MVEENLNWKNLIHGGERNYYVPIILSFIAIYLAPMLNQRGLNLDLMIIGSVALVVFYVLRFRLKAVPSKFDYLKLAIIVLYGLSVLSLNTYFPYTKQVTIALWGLLLYTYAFDRIILKIMKTFGIIFNVCALLVSIFFVVFAQIQTDYAKEQKAISVSLAKEATALSERAELEASNARKAEANALMALEELEQCLTSK